MEAFSSNFRLRKCRPKREHSLMDQISSLPTDILLFILSFLSLKEAARTSVVSKRWIDLWMFVGRRNLEDPDVHPEALWLNRDVELASQRKFIEWVNKVLEKHKALELEEFRICFDLNCYENQKKEINEWVRYACARKKQVLELDVSRHLDRAKPYCFHPRLLGLSSEIDFSCLRSLTLVGICFSDGVINLILENFGFLERLIIHHSKNLGNIKICGPSLVLQHLELWLCVGVKSLIVSNTNLVSLKICMGGNLGARFHTIENVPRLVNVHVFGAFVLRKVIPVLSDCLSKLEVLTLEVNAFTEVLKEISQVQKVKGQVLSVHSTLVHYLFLQSTGSIAFALP